MEMLFMHTYYAMDIKLHACLRKSDGNVAHIDFFSLKWNNVCYVIKVFQHRYLHTVVFTA